MDVEVYIKPGDDFVAILNWRVAEADVLLAVIGPHWSELLAARASAPNDFVAIEIKAALEKGKLVIPVLVRGATMPAANSCPRRLWNESPPSKGKLLLQRVSVRRERRDHNLRGHLVRQPPRREDAARPGGIQKRDVFRLAGSELTENGYRAASSRSVENSWST